MATIAARLGPADHGRRLTIEEFAAAEVEQGHRYELGRGVLEVTQVPGESHAVVVYRLMAAFFDYDRSHPDLIFRIGGGSEFQIWVPELASGRNPDAAVALRASPRDARGFKPPSLAVEVVSRRGEDRDYVAKRKDYLVFGLTEYWIVDPVALKVTVLVRDGDDWAEHVYQGDAPVESAVLPGVAVTADALLHDLEPDDDGGDAA